MEKLWLFPVVAIIVEALTEYIKNMLVKRDKKTLITQLSALGLSVLICITANADLFATMGIPIRIPMMGCVLTAVFASRGANYMSDLLGRLQKAKTPELPDRKQEEP